MSMPNVTSLCDSYGRDPSQKWPNKRVDGGCYNWCSCISKCSPWGWMESNWLRWNLIAWALTISCNALKPRGSWARRKDRSGMLAARSSGRTIVLTFARRYTVRGACSSVSIQNPANSGTWNFHERKEWLTLTSASVSSTECLCTPLHCIGGDHAKVLLSVRSRCHCTEGVPNQAHI